MTGRIQRLKRVEKSDPKNPFKEIVICDFVCVYVHIIERERLNVCVCACERERERGERERV